MAQQSSGARSKRETTGEGGQSGPRERRRRRRIATGREQILDTAEELFGSLGFRGTSLQQVADRCEYSVGALYQFFDSKTALLQAVLNRRGDAQLELMQTCVEQNLPADEQLVELVRTIIGYFRRYPSYGRLAVRLQSPGLESYPDPDYYEQGFRRAIDLYTAVIARGQRDGVLRGGDPASLARLLSQMVSGHHAMDAVLTGGESALSDDEFLSFVAHAFRPDALD